MSDGYASLEVHSLSASTCVSDVLKMLCILFSGIKHTISTFPCDHHHICLWSWREVCSDHNFCRKTEESCQLNDCNFMTLIFGTHFWAWQMKSGHQWFSGEQGSGKILFLNSIAALLLWSNFVEVDGGVGLSVCLRFVLSVTINVSRPSV